MFINVADEYAIELLHRARMHTDQNARIVVQQYLGRVVRRWLYGHPKRDAYLLFHCGLKPQEIIHCCAQEFSAIRVRRVPVYPGWPQHE